MWTDSICREILQPGGEEFLRLMHRLYVGCESILLDAGQVGQAVDLGLARMHAGRPVLTAAGYIVGNIAKEHCIWLDGGRCLPMPHPPGWMVDDCDVLDLGCSYGRWLWQFQRTARSVVGLEMQPEYIALGRALAQREGVEPPPVHCGSAEDVLQYVPPASLDLVFARLVFNHVHIGRTLRGAWAVLRPGGVLWMHVEPLRVVLRRLTRHRRLPSVCFDLFAVANSLLFTLSGWQTGVAWPGRMHAVHKPCYPSQACWRKVLSQAGYEGFQPVEGVAPVFWARKRG